MEYDQLFADFGIAPLQLLLGLSIGLIFGLGAALSQLCIRNMVNEVSHRTIGRASTTWILGACSAYLGATFLLGSEATDISEAASLANDASLSGPIIGGLLFGMGMIISRGCSSRLLILTAHGNMRAPVTLFAFAFSAQLVYGGQLATTRLDIQSWWRFTGDSLLLPDLLNLPSMVFTAIALATGLVCIYVLAQRHAWSKIVGAVLVGLAVAIGWASTAFVSYHTFGEIMPQSISFTAPLAETINTLLTAEQSLLRLGVGMITGTLLGSLCVSIWRRDWRLEAFDEQRPLSRYLLAGCMMGTGAVFAGGCSIGAGLSGTSVLSAQAVIALFAMTSGGLIALKLGFAKG
jgi:uncharacterized membrane protein YedE/YeeE